MHLQFICWNRAQTCALFNCYLVIVAWLPRPAIYASLRAKCAPLAALSICYRSQWPLSRNSLHHNTSSSGTWIAPSLRWRMCFAATAKPIVKNMALRFQVHSAVS
jgi:hypothetical protein